MIKLNKILFGVLGVLSLLTFAACSGTDSKSEQSPETSEAAADTTLQEAPSFAVTTINDQKISLQKSLNENKPMVVYFTASWCPICAKNWPSLSEVYPEYKDKLNLVAISIDPSDTEEVIRKLSEKENFTFPVTKGYPDVMVDFGVQSQATTVGINREGKIVFQRNKTALSADQYRSLFDQLVKDSS